MIKQIESTPLMLQADILSHARYCQDTLEGLVGDIKDLFNDYRDGRLEVIQTVLETVFKHQELIERYTLELAKVDI